MSTIGLELMNYINPDLTWKTVAKGYRSSSRRTRKNVLRNFAVGEELVHQGLRKVDEGTASDTEKHGVAILGRRFSDKIENIPLKKRRFMHRSNTPPPRSPFELPANGKRRVRATVDGNRGGPERKSTKVKETAFDLGEDFSGMEILAAVACSNSMIGDVDLDTDRSLLESLTQDGTALCASEAPAVKNVSSSTDTACDETDMESSLLGNSEGVLQRPHITKEIEVVEGSGSARDDRLHWDLNVPEDAWEKPCDASTIESLAKNSEFTVESKDNIHSFAKHVTEDAKEELPLCHLEASSGQNGFKSCVELDENSKGQISVSAVNEHLVYEVADVKGSSKISEVISSLGYLDTVKSSGKDGDASTSPGSLDLEKPAHESDAGFIEDGQDTGAGISVSNEAAGYDDSYGSDVYQTEKVEMGGAGSNNELQAGYDSQFEDGELRESDARYYWDENNEGEDGEVEHVDYGSECGDEEMLGSMHEKEVEFVRGGSTPGSYDRKVDCSRKADITHDDSVSPKSRVLDVPLEKSLATGLAATRTLQGHFASCAEGPDARKNPYSRSRSENCRNVFPRDERDNMGGPRRYMGRERVGMHMRGRSPGRCAGNPSTSSWNFERRYSPTRPSYLPGRPRNNIDGRRYMMSSDRNMDSDGGGYFDNRLNRQFVNSPPNGVYEQRIMRRRSPSNRHDSAYMNARMLPMRDMSPARDRFRRFTPGGGRGGGIRDEFRRPLPEDSAEYPNRIGQHRPSLKRDRGISPLPRHLSRRPHMAMPYRRPSRSRSRSRSPPIYMQRREQQRNDGGGSVLRSRSPDGMRARLPFQKRFPAKYEDRFTSPTRNHFSNRCDVRSFDDRGVDGFRGGGGRKLPPARMYRPQQQQQGNNRFDPQRSFDFRPARKFRDGVDSNRVNGGAAAEYEGSDDERSKRNHRFEMSRPRRYDTEEGARPMRPFRWNATGDDLLEAANGSSSNFDNGGGNNVDSRGNDNNNDVIRRAAAAAAVEE
ncbi:unnamed protein product [Linum trigynum]|uniref:Uncharacterized protein n=1 Tax=Linum trigynum TaxID=586398 RepID=A0AAV2G3Q1_9ROSI